MRHAILPLSLMLLVVVPASAQDATQDPPVLPDWLAVHGQATLTVQATPGFASPYQGDHSLTPHQIRETTDATLFAGVRPWAGGEAWVNPEADQGFGLSNTLGVAGFPSAEAYKVGNANPYVRLQRLFFRQTIGLDGEDEAVDGAANQFAGRRDHDRVTVTIGKFGVGDVFDTNRYAHDPRGDFLNWAAVDAGSFDYAADAWGYSTGVAVELYHGAWTLRAGLFNLSTIPNGETLESGFGQRQIDGEIEHRHRLGGHDGAVRVTLFANCGRFGRFADALAIAPAGTAPDTATVRRPQDRLGVHLNVEQEVADGIGVFARAGIADDAIEPYDFTDIDRTAAAGVSIDGARWARKGDTVGVALIANGIGPEHQRYLAAGGLGVLVGDGRLPHPGTEAIGEVYYSWKPLPPVAVTADYQLVANPGYNRDRGPANVFALRLHGQF